MVWEKWFEDSGSRKVVDQKKVDLYYKLPYFWFWFEKSGWPEKKSEFAKPLFYTFLEKWLQIKCLNVFCKYPQIRETVPWTSQLFQMILIATDISARLKYLQITGYLFSEIIFSLSTGRKFKRDWFHLTILTSQISLKVF